MQNNFRRQVLQAVLAPLALILMCLLPSLASAEIIDDIGLRTDVNGEVDAVLKFTVPIHYVRHFPQKKSNILSIYFTILNSVPPDQWQDYETHRSPPSDTILGFTVTTRDLNTGPRIDVQFARPTEFKIYIGKDGRSLILRFKPEIPPQKDESKSEATKALGAVISPIATTIPAMAAVLPKPGGASTSAPTASAQSVAAPPPVAAVPVAPVPAAAETTALGTELPPLSQSIPDAPVTVPSRAGVAQLGGKDGLPLFPEIEQVPLEETKTQATENLSLDDQIKRANTQAAVHMARARDAFLAGALFVSIEALNNVLSLPPNKYSSDAQIWIGIAREKSGQPAKAVSEYQTYLKLYPDGAGATWVKDRLAKLKSIQPSLFAVSAAPTNIQSRAQSTEFQTMEYGSVSMYYYRGSSHTETVTTVGTNQVPTSLTLTDQSSMITNVSMTARSYNNEFDNRLVFQDFFAANLLPGQKNKNRLNAAFYDVKNRINDYSARIGRQSAMGGGVLGRFDGVNAGYGFMSNWRANVVAGKLSDATIGPRPTFYGGSLDFGANSPIGGSAYAISQTVSGINDRRAIGGNVRYFDQQKTLMTMLDYDVQFKDLNMLTVQGTLNRESGTNYNFLLDRRKTPLLSLRSAVNGTAASIDTLIQNGWTKEDLILLAKERTAVSNMAQFGVTNQLNEKWQMGTDVSVSNTSGLKESGTQFTDPFTGAVTTGLDGYVPGTPASGNTWTLSERLAGNSVFSKNGMSMCSVSFTKSHLMTGKSLLLNSREYLQEKAIVDGMLRFYWQTDSFGGKQNSISPTIKYSYRLKTSLTVEAELGLDWTKATPSTLQSSKTTRKYSSFGFRWDF